MFASEFSLNFHTCSSLGQRYWFLLWDLLSALDFYTFTFAHSLPALSLGFLFAILEQLQFAPQV